MKNEQFVVELENQRVYEFFGVGGVKINGKQAIINVN